jgi:hypothetical protein
VNSALYRRMWEFDQDADHAADLPSV